MVFISPMVSKRVNAYKELILHAVRHSDGLSEDSIVLPASDYVGSSHVNISDKVTILDSLPETIRGKVLISLKEKNKFSTEEIATRIRLIKSFLDELLKNKNELNMDRLRDLMSRVSAPNKEIEKDKSLFEKVKGISITDFDFLYGGIRIEKLVLEAQRAFNVLNTNADLTNPYKTTLEIINGVDKTVMEPNEIRGLTDLIFKVLDL